MTTYEIIEKHSKPIIQDYLDDLVATDKNTIESNPCVPFLHYTKFTGTHLVCLHEADDKKWPEAGEAVEYLFGFANRETILKGLVEVAEYMDSQSNGTVKLTMYYDGKHVRIIDTKTAVQIAKSYRDRILNAWRLEERMVSRDGKTVITFKKQHKEMAEI
mgnify:CR=1 FL=1